MAVCRGLRPRGRVLRSWAAHCRETQAQGVPLRRCVSRGPHETTSGKHSPWGGRKLPPCVPLSFRPGWLRVTVQAAGSGGALSGKLSGVPQTAKVEGTVSHKATLISDASHKFKAFPRLCQVG